MHADGKRRGRKRERDDVYFVKTLSKIQEIRDTIQKQKEFNINKDLLHSQSIEPKSPYKHNTPRISISNYDKRLK